MTQLACLKGIQKLPVLAFNFDRLQLYENLIFWLCSPECPLTIKEILVVRKDERYWNRGPMPRTPGESSFVESEYRQDRLDVALDIHENSSLQKRARKATLRVPWRRVNIQRGGIPGDGKSILERGLEELKS